MRLSTSILLLSAAFVASVPAPAPNELQTTPDETRLPRSATDPKPHAPKPHANPGGIQHIAAKNTNAPSGKDLPQCQADRGEEQNPTMPWWKWGAIQACNGIFPDNSATQQMGYGVQYVTVSIPLWKGQGSGNTRSYQFKISQKNKGWPGQLLQFDDCVQGFAGNIQQWQNVNNMCWGTISPNENRWNDTILTIGSWHSYLEAKGYGTLTFDTTAGLIGT